MKIPLMRENRMMTHAKKNSIYLTIKLMKNKKMEKLQKMKNLNRSLAKIVALSMKNEVRNMKKVKMKICLGQVVCSTNQIFSQKTK